MVSGLNWHLWVGLGPDQLLSNLQENDFQVPNDKFTNEILESAVLLLLPATKNPCLSCPSLNLAFQELHVTFDAFFPHPAPKVHHWIPLMRLLKLNPVLSISVSSFRSSWSSPWIVKLPCHDPLRVHSLCSSQDGLLEIWITGYAPHHHLMLEPAVDTYRIRYNLPAHFLSSKSWPPSTSSSSSLPWSPCSQ